MTQIEHISDTAKWVAVYRAMETKRPDAIFRDPYAERLAGAQGQAIVDGMKRGRAMAWAMIVRTAVFDEIILERIRNGNVDVVLNLAAGLDARPWRMKLPPTLRWIDVDLPGILDHKTEIMKDEKPVCEYEAIRLDLADVTRRQSLFSQINADSQRVLVVSEGLVIYLKPDDVASLARDLHAARHFQWWVFDLDQSRPAGHDAEDVGPKRSKRATHRFSSHRPKARISSGRSDGRSASTTRRWTTRDDFTAR